MCTQRRADAVEPLDVRLQKDPLAIFCHRRPLHRLREFLLGLTLFDLQIHYLVRDLPRRIDDDYALVPVDSNRIICRYIRRERLTPDDSGNTLALCKKCDVACTPARVDHDPLDVPGIDYRHEFASENVVGNEDGIPFKPYLAPFLPLERFQEEVLYVLYVVASLPHVLIRKLSKRIDEHFRSALNRPLGSME